MKKRNRILLAGLVVVLAGGIAWLTLRTREPVYQGKTFNRLAGTGCEQLASYILTESTARLPSGRRQEGASEGGGGSSRKTYRHKCPALSYKNGRGEKFSPQD
jgi:hypothetical protein